MILVLLGFFLPWLFWGAVFIGLLIEFWWVPVAFLLWGTYLNLTDSRRKAQR